jgi:hypothetical protein
MLMISRRDWCALDPREVECTDSLEFTNTQNDKTPGGL